jgi:ACR3 family arsenite efflux pump ArsB
MSIDRLINLGVTLTLIELMVTIGLGVTFAQVAHVARNGRLVAQATLANYIFAPAAAVALMMVFHPHPMVAAGFLMAAVCPGAPYGPPFTAMAKGNEPVAVGLMVILAASSAIVAPLLLFLLLPLVAGSEDLRVNAAKIVTNLLVCQLLPLCIGLLLRQAPTRPGRTAEGARNAAGHRTQPCGVRRDPGGSVPPAKAHSPGRLWRHASLGRRFHCARLAARWAGREQPEGDGAQYRPCCNCC